MFSSISVYVLFFFSHASVWGVAYYFPCSCSYGVLRIFFHAHVWGVVYFFFFFFFFSHDHAPPDPDTLTWLGGLRLAAVSC